MFYRKATEEDFKRGHEVYRDIPEEIKQVIERTRKVTPEVIKKYRELTCGASLQVSAQVCKGYLALLNAHVDFLCGEVVYTKY